MSRNRRHFLPSWVIAVALLAVPVAAFFGTLLVVLAVAPPGCGAAEAPYVLTLLVGVTSASFLGVLVAAVRRFGSDDPSDKDGK